MSFCFRWTLVLIAVVCAPISLWAADAKTKAAPAVQKPKTEAEVPKDATKSDDGDKNWVTVKGNFFDFDETLLQGRYKAPNGMMLQGRKAQEKKQMVNLRKDFKSNIINSRAAVRSVLP